MKKLIVLILPVILGLLVAALADSSDNSRLVEMRPAEPGTGYVFQGEVVEGLWSSPVSDAVVAVHGDSTRSQTIAVNGEGKFTFKLDNAFPWRSTVTVRKGTRVAPYVLLNEKTKLRSTFRLGKAASVSGRVIGGSGGWGDGGKVALLEAGYIGTIPAAFGMIEPDGTYQIDGLSPGEYNFHVLHPSYTLSGPREPDSARGPAVTLTPGEAAEVDLEVLENAFLSGHVTGPDGLPVVGLDVPVGYGSWDYPVCTLTTDSKGYFSGNVPPSVHRRSLRIEHPELGFALFHLPALAPRERLEGITLQLSGKARFAGTVRGTGGVPIQGVEVEGVYTDDEGRFDTGWINLEHGQERFTVQFYPPGMAAQSSSNPRLAPGNTVPAGQEHYEEAYRHLVVRHGENHTVDIQLQPRPFRTLRGQVLYPTGDPVPDATLLIYQGLIPTEQWVSDYTDAAPPEPEPFLRDCGNVPIRGAAFLMARERSDRNGRFEVRVYPHPVDLDCTGIPQSNPRHHTIVAVDQEFSGFGVSRLVAFEEIEGTEQTEVMLEPVDHKVVTTLAIRDRAGNPVAGLPWVLNCDYGHLVSDQEGQLHVPRVSTRIELSPAIDGFVIFDVEVNGTIAIAPAPAHDTERDWLDLATLRICRRGIEDLPRGSELELKRERNWVSLPFFDATQAEVTIVVEEATP